MFKWRADDPNIQTSFRKNSARKVSVPCTTISYSISSPNQFARSRLTLRFALKLKSLQEPRKSYAGNGNRVTAATTASKHNNTSIWLYRCPNSHFSSCKSLATRRVIKTVTCGEETKHNFTRPPHKTNIKTQAQRAKIPRTHLSCNRKTQKLLWHDVAKKKKKSRFRSPRYVRDLNNNTFIGALYDLFSERLGGFRVSSGTVSLNIVGYYYSPSGLPNKTFRLLQVLWTYPVTTGNGRIQPVSRCGHL